MGKLQDRVEDLYMDYFQFFKRHRGNIVVLGAEVGADVVKLEYYSGRMFEAGVQEMNLSAKPFSLATGTIDIECKAGGLLGGGKAIDLENPAMANLKKVVGLCGKGICPVIKFNLKPKQALGKEAYTVNAAEAKDAGWLEIVDAESQKLIKFRQDLVDYFELQKQLKGFLAEKPKQEKKGFK